MKEPIGSDKPFRLNFDDKGLCFASPLQDGEVPALPAYTEALQMSPILMRQLELAAAESKKGEEVDPQLQQSLANQ
jgi:hypothetical protein